ncbi:MAG: hypothetical protein ACOVMP_09095 [Chthoniobacterales bacterium]
MRHNLNSVCVIFSVVLSASLSHAEPMYNTILGLNDSATGVRGTDTTDSGNVILTGSQQISGVTQGMLWSGNLYSNVGTFYSILPQVSGTISSSIYYGPDTPAFNPLIPAGQIRAVGTYQLQGETGTFGFLYAGALQSGTYPVTSINVQGAVNTIPHSTAGEVVVGAYDNGSATTGNAFIFNITTGLYQTLSIGQEASLYGVWHSGGTDYVLAGGAQNPGAGDVNQAFLANYNSTSGLITGLTYYTFNNLGGAISHFEGITAVEGGYNLISTVSDNGDGSAIGAALAFVSVAGGVFNPTAVWTAIDYPSSDLTTGNTVYQDVGIGVYAMAGSPNVSTYTAVIPEPSISALALLGAGALLWRLRARRRA